MVAKKQTPVLEPDTTEKEEYQEPQAEEVSFDLEHLDANSQSFLKAWGNSTLVCIENLRPQTPEWSRFIEMFFEVIKVHVQEHAE